MTAEEREQQQGEERAQAVAFRDTFKKLTVGDMLRLTVEDFAYLQASIDDTNYPPELSVMLRIADALGVKADA